MPGRLGVITHRRAKLGENASVCEDVINVQRRVEEDGESVRVGVSDGATMTSFARSWAELLTHWFANRMFSSTAFHDQAAFARALRLVRILWSLRVPKNLPWHSEVKVAEGAGATLLGVEIAYRGSSLTWEALAVGDTCLLQYDGARITRSFPVTTSDGFANTPDLISSAADSAIPVPTVMRGTLGEDGVLVVATDALAKYLIEHDGEIDPLELVADARCDERLDALRMAGTMKNDDVALALIRPEPS
ncbi:MAG TPA: protein phosphatase 2C domain-containing protein [Candidatus Elarobacter sp.]|nr:protein phosphatase 2C domain-containing protein [Candidatus Elarobacter sp.]